MMIRLCIAVLALLSSGAWSAELTGRVVAVSDGDTLTVLAPGDVSEKIRLSGIDAPELSQPFGHTSKRHLSEQAYGRQVVVEWVKRDRYGRIVGKVLVDGVDAGLEQMKAGMAWHYKKYMGEQTLEDRLTYIRAEQSARDGHVGLWSEADAVPPWDWRKSK